MANDLNNWLDGAPVIGSEFNGNFDFWLDAAPFLDIEPSGSNNGAADIQLGALTSSATGRVQVAGAASITLGALTLAGTGIAGSEGALTVTLGEATSTSAGGVRVTGDAANTLDAATISAAGIAVAGGTLDVTLGALTGTGTISLVTNGNLDATLDSITLVSAGVVAEAIAGNLSITLDACSVSATMSLGELPFFLISDADLLQAVRAGYFYYDYQKFVNDTETTAAAVSSNQELERLISMVESTPRLRGWLLVPTMDYSSTRPAQVSIYDLRKIRHIFRPVDTNPVFPQA